jgi:peptidoglycan-associated lipoprotein
VKFSKGVLEMKKLALAMALLAMCSAVACKKNPPQEPVASAPTAPPPAPAPTEASAPVEDEYSKLKKMSVDEIDRLKLLADVHFDFDKSDVREADKAVLSKNADVLKMFDFLKVAVEGHCDERGSVEYNLALGERRAKAAMDYLVGLGVPADRLRTVSYGKEVPLCSDHTEDCWARNRRAHFTVAEKIKK